MVKRSKLLRFRLKVEVVRRSRDAVESIEQGHCSRPARDTRHSCTKNQEVDHRVHRPRYRDTNASEPAPATLFCTSRVTFCRDSQGTTRAPFSRPLLGELCPLPFEHHARNFPPPSKENLPFAGLLDVLRCTFIGNNFSRYSFLPVDDFPFPKRRHDPLYVDIELSFESNLPRGNIRKYSIGQIADIVQMYRNRIEIKKKEQVPILFSQDSALSRESTRFFLSSKRHRRRVRILELHRISRIELRKFSQRKHRKRKRTIGTPCLEWIRW